MKKILLVDDDIGLTKLIKLNLEATGLYEVTIENSSKQALRTVKTTHPDLIVLDYIMPGMDGGDVMTQLKDDPFASRIPVIMLTALVTGEDTTEDGELESGGQIMLPKPVQFDVLLRCIERQLIHAAAVQR